ncbi:IS1595 family transposase [Pseudomonas aeruginosa]|uniref:IS1595 family transposase n=1 Tax=Pseudomonas aeruginosa TaxID=287 RepID=UPI000FD486A3|nr:IS1595 family transposase [Pseudomonas aeruginosa]MBI8696879.1 IS1595 family transposase [Pseudomonas aeruginosa]MDU0612113.1 IS1595 family transposase [Pseudomonas aeruginosa]RUF16101.1 IS1595 family transposase [Pseudomonas aeruginosa]
MAMNRVQFQSGLSLPAFLKRYGSERQCEQALEASRWPQGFVCPRCAGSAHSRFKRRAAVYWQCTACHRQTSLRAGTVMDNSKLPLRSWFLAMYLLGQSKTNLSALELMRHLGVSYPAAWRMKHKLMQAMAEREASRKLGGIVQLDDAYLGGERNGGKAGRGSENKRPFVIAVETTEDGRPRHAAIDPVPGFTKAALSDWIGQRLHPGSDVYSDGLGAFRALEAEHAHTVIEGSGRSRCEEDNARWVNVVLSNLKRSLDGAYHAFKFAKYAHRYLAETMWRFNRRFDLTTLVPSLLATATAAKPWPERVLRDVPVFSTESAC